MVEKWSKLADAQVKLTSAPGASSGLRCVNGNVAGVEGIILGKGQGYLEIALEQAEKSRGELWEENGRLKGLVTGALNDIQGVLSLARSLLNENPEEVSTLSFIHTDISLNITRPFHYDSLQH